MKLFSKISSLTGSLSLGPEIKGTEQAYFNESQQYCNKAFSENGGKIFPFKKVPPGLVWATYEPRLLGYKA